MHSISLAFLRPHQHAILGPFPFDIGLLPPAIPRSFALKSSSVPGQRGEFGQVLQTLRFCADSPGISRVGVLREESTRPQHFKCAWWSIYTP